MLLWALTTSVPLGPPVGSQVTNGLQQGTVPSVRLAGAETVGFYGDGSLKGVPAITRHTPGAG